MKHIYLIRKKYYKLKCGIWLDNRYQERCSGAYLIDDPATCCTGDCGEGGGNNFPTGISIHEIILYIIVDV